MPRRKQPGRLLHGRVTGLEVAQPSLDKTLEQPSAARCNRLHRFQDARYIASPAILFPEEPDDGRSCRRSRTLAN